jgi:hypothetical protein
MEQQKQFMIKPVLDAWNSRLETANKMFNSFTDEDLLKEVSPGRNRAIYLLGHLAAVHDKMLPLLNFESQLYPQLEEPFLTQPDKAVSVIPSAKEIRAAWQTINAKLSAHFNNLSNDEWFQKHSAVSAEDFVKEPHRNRLNVLIGRTNHLQYHMGQIALIKNNEE